MHRVWLANCRPLLNAPRLLAVGQEARQAAVQVERKDVALKSGREIPGPPTYPLVGCMPSLMALIKCEFLFLHFSEQVFMFENRE